MVSWQVKTGGAVETVNSELVIVETVGTGGNVAVGWTGDTVCTADVDVEAVGNGWVYTVASCSWNVVLGMIGCDGVL